MDIHTKARDGDLEGVRDALAEGCDASWIHPKTGTTPLYNAVDKGHYDVAELLLSTNADPDLAPDDGFPPLYSAANRGAANITELLLSHNADPNRCLSTGMSPLMVAIRKKHWKVVVMLLDEGADVSQADSKGITPLMAALEKNSIEGIELLLKYDADINEVFSDGVPLLHRLCQQNGLSETSISLLRDYGGDIDILDDDHELSALHWTIMHRRDKTASKTVETLIKYGLPVDLLCGIPIPLTPLTLLCECDELENKTENERKIANMALSSITSTLLNSKANPLVKTSDGSQYALAYAYTRSNKEAIINAAKGCLSKDILIQLLGEEAMIEKIPKVENPTEEGSCITDGKGKKGPKKERKRASIMIKETNTINKDERKETSNTKKDKTEPPNDSPKNNNNKRPPKRKDGRSFTGSLKRGTSLIGSLLSPRIIKQEIISDEEASSSNNIPHTFNFEQQNNKEKDEIEEKELKAINNKKERQKKQEKIEVKITPPNMIDDNSELLSVAHSNNLNIPRFGGVKFGKRVQ